jgi:nucleotide-binding universal stress UspA family protein
MENARSSDVDKRGGSIHRILLASDLTAYSDRAFDRAVKLTEQFKANLRILHVVDSSLLPAQHAEQNIREAKIRLEREVRESGAGELADVLVKPSSGEADKVILEEASVLQADLIVMGLAAHATFAAVFGGTTIDRVIRGAHCPVLTVKTRPRRDYGSIMVAVDGGEPSRRALEFALRGFPSARFTILHIDEKSTASAAKTEQPGSPEIRHQVEDMVRARCAAAGRPNPGAPDGPTLITKAGRARDLLQEEIARLDPDLVVLGTHGRAGVSRMFLGSVAETLLEVLARDVLVARA